MEQLIKQDDVLSVPKGWEIKKLGEVCEFQGGSQPAKSNFIFENRSGYVRFLQIRDFGSDKNITYIPASVKNRYCNEDDILLGRYGASVGKVLINKSGAYNVAVMKTIPDTDILNKRYFFFYLISNEFQVKLGNVASRSAQDGFSKDDIYDFPILIPPLSEQQRIVSVLDQTFAVLVQAKENAQRNLQNAKEIFESYLQGVFWRKGDGWEEMALGELATFRNGMNFTKTSKGEEIDIVGVKDFQKSFWVPYEYLDSVNIDGKLNEIDFLHEGDILAVRSNGNPELIGRTLLAGNVLGKVSHSGFTIRIRLNKKNILPIYLCHYLKTQKTRKELVDSGNGVGIKSLNQGSLSSLQIHFPKSLKEQQTIVTNLETLSAETKRLEVIYQQKLINLEELKKSVLQKAFNGDLITNKK